MDKPPTCPLECLMVTVPQCSNALLSKLSTRLPKSFTPKIHQCSSVLKNQSSKWKQFSKALLRKLSTCRVNPLHLLVVWTRTQLNVTLPHRDVRIVEGPIARAVRLELKRLWIERAVRRRFREKPQKIARAMST